MHRYVIRIGPKELPSVYGDDRRARKVASRWIRMFWARYVEHIARARPGSMAHAEAEGWYSPPVCEIYRSARLLAGDIVPAKPYTRIEHFEMSTEPMAEFNRIAR